ncbi:MAG TPA: hypothetical protein VK749_13655 [Xanthobacteraceae bacterium]|nr:hypothetical protein [Xanthobacteraceae bacterium]
MPQNSAIPLSLEGISVDNSQRALVDAIRLRARNGAAEDLRDTAAETVVQDFLRVASVFWSEPFRARFSATPLDVLIPDFFHACAVRTDEGPRVVIYRGLLKAMTYYLELMRLRAGIEANIKKLPRSVGTPEEFNAAKTIAMLPLLMYITAKRANLPRLGFSLHRSAMDDAFNHFAVSLSFIAMHEIGHLELGHLGPAGAASATTPPLLAQVEDLNLFKLQEFEADSFVFEGIRPEWRYFAGGACTAMLGMLSHIEIYLQKNSDTHPVSLNRLQHALTGFGGQAPAGGGKLRSTLEDASERLRASILQRANREIVGWDRPSSEDVASAYEVADFAIETLQSFYRAAVGPEEPGLVLDEEISRRAKAWNLWADYLTSKDCEYSLAL